MTCVGHVGIARPGQPEADPTGQYLRSYDPEAHDGQGNAVWTADLAEALRFDSKPDLMRCWQQVPRSRPRRPDGRPNKPLTAFSVSCEPVPE